VTAAADNERERHRYTPNATGGKNDTPRIGIVEASIADIAAALDNGLLSSVELVAAYLNRIAFFDRHGITLNAVPVLDPTMFLEARAADTRRSRGEARGPLDGIPYTAKDSYAAKGLTVAAGSPAFEKLIAHVDAFAIERLRAAGAILIGLTNMPPMAAGGMQRGVYGRAESPYNGNFLPAAFASGSSNGAGTATAASFAAFGLGEETWSSGRAPASNNGLVAYTPSRGLISMRGNWPLVPTMDVVVPLTRSMGDLLTLLDALVVDDPNPRGDFWRVQRALTIPRASEIRPDTFRGAIGGGRLDGRRFGIPRMYINKDKDAPKPITTRPSVVALWETIAGDLEALGVTIIEVDFPVVSNYERDRPGARSMVDRGLVPTDFGTSEYWHLVQFGWDDFLRANADPAIPSLSAVNGNLIFPATPDTLPDRYDGVPDWALYPAAAGSESVLAPDDIPSLYEGLRGLEETRRLDFEAWLDHNGLDAVVFPACADVAPFDADRNPASNEIAWRNGTWVANGNQAIRHLGIPTVTVPMGVMADIGMPVGLTIAGKAYDDCALLRFAVAIESSSRRSTPQRTPPLADDIFPAGNSSAVAPSARSADSFEIDVQASVSPVADDGSVSVTITGLANAPTRLEHISLWLNGTRLDVEQQAGNRFTASASVAAALHYQLHSRWRKPYGSIIVALAYDASGAVAGAFRVVGGIG
jgi:amidase